MDAPLWPYRVVAGLVCGWFLGRYTYLWIFETLDRRKAKRRKAP